MDNITALSESSTSSPNSTRCLCKRSSRESPICPASAVAFRTKYFWRVAQAPVLQNTNGEDRAEKTDNQNRCEYKCSYCCSAIHHADVIAHRIKGK